MIDKTFKIINPTGLDAKMSNLLVSLSGKYSSKVTLQLNELAVDLKSIMGVMSLNVHKGEFVKVICSGTDEEDALNKLTDLIITNKLGKEY